MATEPLRPIVGFAADGTPDEIARQVARRSAGAALTVLFAGAGSSLGELGAALVAAGVRRVVGASAGRVITEHGFRAHGVSGFHLPAGRFAVADTVLEDVATIPLPELRRRVHALRAAIAAGAGAKLAHGFAFLLVDAESRSEERLAAVLGMELKGVPLVGGSAGDLFFNPLGHPPGSTRLLHDGVALRGAAILTLVASASPVAAYCHNHYLHGIRKFVITDADPARRLVREIDGRPALGVYAAACGFAAPPEDSKDLSVHPLMIRIGGNYYPRGMQRIHADGALEFACAVEPGLVVSVAQPGDMVASLDGLYASMRERIGPPELVIGVDCAARTAYMEREGLAPRIEPLHAANRVRGFSSLGEQFNTMHANNSFTCIGIGGPP